MFFAQRMASILPSDRVLEIGPGSTPQPRANEFLEYHFNDSKVALEQRGNVAINPNFTGRKVHYYDGGRFPFADKEFDYVIASHVVEHTPDPERFMAEVFRVGGGRGYLEYPLHTYEYLFDLGVHLNYVWFDSSYQALNFVRKPLSVLNEFSTITTELRRGMELGWDDLLCNNLPLFIQGFEFFAPFSVREMHSLNAYRPHWENPGTGVARRLVRKVEALFPKSTRSDG
jgi:SAM-dependent methyltransferase